MADPFLKFYTSDWRADPRLKMCGLAARGMWIEMICLMHEATPYGHLLIHGQTPNEAQLASLTGTPVAELPDLIAELERLGVFSRTREGVIYSRKLVRMASKSAKARKNGKQGGNPNLRKDYENTGSLNLKDKGGDKPQKPDAIFQKEEIGKPISPPFSPFSDFWSVWPNRVSKADAETAWRKLTPDEKADAIRCVVPWFEKWRAANPQASPIHAATYLNKRRWTDETAALPNNSQQGKVNGNGWSDTWRGIISDARMADGQDRDPAFTLLPPGRGPGNH